MKRAIVIYSSKTGNTKQVAEAIQSALPEGTPCVPVTEVPANVGEYDLAFMGFWADRGSADAAAQTVIKTLNNKEIALFATLGVPPEMPHATETMVAASGLLPEGKKPVATFHCQGKVDPKVIEMMYKMFPAGSAHGKSPERDAMHAQASSHPNEDDFAKARDFAKKVYEA